MCRRLPPELLSMTLETTTFASRDLARIALTGYSFLPFAQQHLYREVKMKLFIRDHELHRDGYDTEGLPIPSLSGGRSTREWSVRSNAQLRRFVKEIVLLGHESHHVTEEEEANATMTIKAILELLPNLNSIRFLGLQSAAVDKLLANSAVLRRSQGSSPQLSLHMLSLSPPPHEYWVARDLLKPLLCPWTTFETMAGFDGRLVLASSRHSLRKLALIHDFAWRLEVSRTLVELELLQGIDSCALDLRTLRLVFSASPCLVSLSLNAYIPLQDRRDIASAVKEDSLLPPTLQNLSFSLRTGYEDQDMLDFVTGLSEQPSIRKLEYAQPWGPADDDFTWWDLKDECKARGIKLVWT